MSIIPLSNLFEKALERAGITRQVLSAMVMDRFMRIVEDQLGPVATNKVKPLYLKDKVLTVACLSSVMAQELKLREAGIIARLNATARKPLVNKLRFMA